MKANYDPTRKTKFTSSHRKEGVKCFFESLSVIDLNGSRYGHNQTRVSSAIELRLYGTGNQNFACLWVHGKTINTQGSVRAGGYGYHRPSAAAAEAIRNAGFELTRDTGGHEDIGGVGDSAIEEAMCALAECLGITNYVIVRSHP